MNTEKSTLVWIRENNICAESQGWNLFECTGGTLDGKYAIQKVDAMDRFASDEEAIKYVQKLADHCDETASKAIAMHGQSF